jgi:hypothetical protein
MIRYRLRCDKSHEFEAWFRNSHSFDGQAKRGQVTCPACGSASVHKALMAPSVAVKGNKKREVVAVNNEATKQVATRAQFLEAMRQMRAEVEAKADYVGPRFAEEARKIHYEETEARGIYGEASMEDVRELHEEGIEFYPLPALPEEQN